MRTVYVTFTNLSRILLNLTFINFPAVAAPVVTAAGGEPRRVPGANPGPRAGRPPRLPAAARLQRARHAHPGHHTHRSVVYDANTDNNGSTISSHKREIVWRGRDAT